MISTRARPTIYRPDARRSNIFPDVLEAGFQATASFDRHTCGPEILLKTRVVFQEVCRPEIPSVRPDNTLCTPQERYEMGLPTNPNIFDVPGSSWFEKSPKVYSIYSPTKFKNIKSNTLIM